jgi:hypothetical protein
MIRQLQQRLELSRRLPRSFYSLAMTARKCDASNGHCGALFAEAISKVSLLEMVHQSSSVLD